MICRVHTWAELMATPDADTPPGPALPVPAPEALPLPKLKTNEIEKEDVTYLHLQDWFNKNEVNYVDWNLSPDWPIHQIHQHDQVGEALGDREGIEDEPRQQPKQQSKQSVPVH